MEHMSDTISEIKHSVKHKGKKMYQKEDNNLAQGLLTPPESETSESEQIVIESRLETAIVHDTKVAEPPKPDESNYSRTTS